MRTPLLFATIPFSIGIIAQRESLWLALLLIVVAWLSPKGNRIAILIFGILGAIMAMCTQITNSIPYDSQVEIITRVERNPTIKGRWQRTVGSIISYKESTDTWRDARQRVQIYIDTASPIARGNTILFSTKQRTIFDFYLKQGFTGRVYGYRPTILTTNTTLIERSIDIRNQLSQRIAKIPTTPENTALMQALTLGERGGIDPEQRADYNRTGAAHLLAVSGLHVGIIYIILYYVFGWVRLLPRGLFAFSALIILVLWGYAVITGFSPSVLRAVIMFTIYQIGIMLSRESNNVNTLLGAGLILLLCDPNYLYDVGFQLSFVAMFGIVLLYKPIYNLFRNRLWSVVAVSVAAQLAVMPLATYYFGTIPLLGIFTNLALWLVVPIIIVLTFSYLIMGVGFIGNAAAWVAGVQNEMISWGASHSWIAIENITIPLWMLLAIYTVELTLIYMFRKRLSNVTIDWLAASY